MELSSKYLSIKSGTVNIIFISIYPGFFKNSNVTYIVIHFGHDLPVSIVNHAGIFKKDNQMRIVPVFFIAALWLASIGDTRYVSHSEDATSIITVNKPLKTVVLSPSKIIKGKSLRRSGEKRSFVDLLPYVGSFIFRGVVRRVNPRL